MAQRPSRRTQNIFELDNPPVTFEILDPTHTKITVPANSGWRFPVHWHLREDGGCRRVTNLQGRLHTSYTTFASNPVSAGSELPPGEYTAFSTGDHHAFGPSNTDQELVVLLETHQSQISLLRNTCSATLDAELYPALATTPYWVRILYSLLAFSPWARRRFIAEMLWIQLQMMRSTHDFYFQHGYFDMPLLWWFTHPLSWIGDIPPKWTFNIRWKSMTPVSKAVQGTCYWIGRLFLGMKAEYPEYAAAEPEQSVNHSEFIQIQTNAIQTPPEKSDHLG